MRAMGQCWRATKALTVKTEEYIVCGGTGTWRAQPSQHLELNPWLSHGPEGIGLPVRLLRLFPHDYVETRAVLVAEDETSIVIIGDGVYVERALEVHAVEGCVTCRRGEEGGLQKHACSGHLRVRP